MIKTYIFFFSNNRLQIFSFFSPLFFNNIVLIELKSLLGLQIIKIGNKYFQIATYNKLLLKKIN